MSAAWIVPAHSFASPSPGRGGAVPGDTGASDSGAVTYERIVQSGATGDDWLTYSGSYSGQRFSPLKQIDRSSISRMRLAWVQQLEASGSVEATPLVADGVMYVTWPPGGVGALDVATGRTFWTYERQPSKQLALCCGRPNRGVALLGDRVYVGTLDAHLLALDARTGALVWDRKVADADSGYTITAAPLAVRDMIITGYGGGDFGTRGFIDAYDAATGKRRWRFYTVPGPGQPGNETWTGDSWRWGGGAAWMTGSYDPDLDLLYWGVGNPGPVFNGETRKGDNLYTNSVVALDARSGKLRWYFQFTPHGEHDWDAAQVPVQASLRIHGEERKVLVWPNRNGFYYVLDRVTGAFLLARPFAKQTWAESIGPNGRPVVVPGSAPTPEGSAVFPGSEGASNWWPPSFDPQTGLVYVVAADDSAVFTTGPVHQPRGPVSEWQGYGGSADREEGKLSSAVRALDAATGELRWEYRFEPVGKSAAFENASSTFSKSGLLSTAGGLVFGGTTSGAFFALDARTGRELWRRNLGGPIHMAPITFEDRGRQYVAVIAGTVLFTFVAGS